MTKLEALDDCFYDGKVRKKGDQVKAASEEDVRKLVGWGKFKVIERSVKAEPVYETKQEEPEEQDDSEDRRKKKYMRRDMRPKEEQ